MKIQSQILTLIHHLTFFKLGRKKIPVVPISYREKIRVGRSEIIFLKIFFHGFGISTSILTRDAYFLWTNLGNLVQ